MEYLHIFFFAVVSFPYGDHNNNDNKNKDHGSTDASSDSNDIGRW